MVLSAILTSRFLRSLLFPQITPLETYYANLGYEAIVFSDLVRSRDSATFTILSDLALFPNDLVAHAEMPPGIGCYAVSPGIEMGQREQPVLETAQIVLRTEHPDPNVEKFGQLRNF